MAASLSLTQLSSGNSIYDKYYRQVDPSGSGRVSAADAALFLKRSGLADLVLGKIWDLADSERKGCLNKQQFFIALRLVACAQNGLEVAIKSLHLAVPPPKFHDTSSPHLPGGVSIDGPWVVKMEEKLKFDGIFDSLSPAGGMLSGEKVKPVLLNSKLPVDVLGRVWELSDLDRDGMLDRDEFAVAMYLVYRALEGEPVPMALPALLVPPSKRKKPPVSSSPVMPLLPSPPSVKERRSSVSGSKTLPSKPAVAPVVWIVSQPDKAKYDEVFAKTDLDMDGLVSGPEVRDIFLKTGLPSATLARIWELCDIGDMGKLTREQFALALHLINQKLTTGVDPPQNLSSEMVPPSDRLSLAAKQSNAADFSAIKELDSLSNEIVDLQREKISVEQEIKEKEDRIRERTSEVQELQSEVQKESGLLQRLQSQRQEVQDALEDLEQQKSTLEEQLGHIRQQCSQENQLIASLQTEHAEQEQRIEEYEEQLVQAREELLLLQEETQQLEEKVQAAREQLNPLKDTVRDSFSQVSQVQQKLSDLHVEERTVTAQLSWKRALEDDPEPVLVNGTVEERQHKDEPEELRAEPPSSQPLMEPAEPLEEKLEVKEESRPYLEEQEPVSDAFQDLYNSLASTAWPVPQDSFVQEHLSPVLMLKEHSSPTPEVTAAVEDKVDEVDEELAFKASTPKQVDSPGPERRPGSTEPPQAAPPSLPPQTVPPPLPDMVFFQSDPFTDHDPFKDDLFGKADVSDLFGGDPFKGTDPFAADSFFKQSSGAPFLSADPFTPDDPFVSVPSLAEPDPFTAQLNNAPKLDQFSSKPETAAEDPFNSKVNNLDADPFGTKMESMEADPFCPQATAGLDPFSSQPGSELPVKDLTAASNDPFAPGGVTLNTASDPDPFSAVFGNESFGGGFADFSALAKSNGCDPFTSSNNKNVFKGDSQPSSLDTPPALPPKTGTPTRPPPPPPGKRSSISRTESSDSFHRRGLLVAQGSGEPPISQPAKDAAQDPFSPSSPTQPTRDPDRFASFDKQYHTEEDMIEWAKRESEREEKERLARLTQQEQEDLELAIALSKSEFS
ncbi:hypothetical protein UPYG_G00027600 [Umbra pygmaea]|uniref:Epidermal growth factor receptor pathway substrate 15 n=1 Tax=Umbra pygmaea TaxID=75934 RepID=A0ABD0XM29_UMBPY